MTAGSEQAAVVWIDGWQLACCGTPFSIGDAVEWSVREGVDREFLADAISPEAAERIDVSEEHHGDDDAELRGRVRAIRAASCRYAVREGESLSRPVPGSGVLTAVQRADGAGASGTLGWIVEVERSSAG